MLSVLTKLPLLSLTARLTPALLGGTKRQQLEIFMGKTQVDKKQVIIHLIHEGTTHQGEILTLLKRDTSNCTMKHNQI